MGWKQFIVLYEESEALVRLQEVLKMSSQNRGLKITLRQLTPGPGNIGKIYIFKYSHYDAWFERYLPWKENLKCNPYFETVDIQT